MNTIFQLFTIDSVAHIIFILSLVSALGLFIGSIRICGINLGITGVLFSGLLFGYLKVSIDTQILEFLRDFGLVLLCILSAFKLVRVSYHHLKKMVYH